MQVSMPSATISGALPTKAAVSSGAADGQSFSNILQESHLQLSLPASLGASGGRKTLPGSESVIGKGTHKAAALRTPTSGGEKTVGPVVRGQTQLPSLPTAAPAIVQASLALAQPTAVIAAGEPAVANEASTGHSASAPVSGTVSSEAPGSLSPGQVANPSAQTEAAVQPDSDLDELASTSSPAQPSQGAQPHSPVLAFAGYGADAAAIPGGDAGKSVSPVENTTGETDVTAVAQGNINPSLLKQAEGPRPSTRELQAALAPLLPSVTSTHPAPREQVATGHALHPLKPSGTADSTTSTRQVASPLKSAEESMQAKPSRVSPSGNSSEDSGLSSASGTPMEVSTLTPGASSGPAVLQGHLVAAPDVISSPATMPVLGSSSGGGPGVNSPATWGSSSGTTAVTSDSSRRDKSRDDGSSTAGGAQAAAGSGITAAQPVLARSLPEAPMGTAGEGIARDAAPAPVSSFQTSASTTGNNSTEPSGPAAKDDSAIPESGLTGLAQARVLHSLSGSEMHVNLNSEEFGRVSVHAAYGRETITTQITLENSAMGNALGSALNVHLAALETKLGQEHGLLSSVTLAAQHGGTGSASQGHTSNPQAQSQNFGKSGQGSANGAASSPTASPADAAPSASYSTQALPEAGYGRLDIRI